MERLDASHIAAAAGGFEPQRQNNFMLRCTPPGGADPQTIELSMQAFPFPKDTTSIETINYLNSARKFAGRTTFTDAELTLRDYVEQSTAQTMREWRRRVFDPETGKTGLCSGYKIQATLILFAPDGSHERRWKLLGLWPSSSNLGDGNMDNAGQNLITYLMAIDYIIPEVAQAAA